MLLQNVCFLAGINPVRKVPQVPPATSDCHRPRMYTRIKPSSCVFVVVVVAVVLF